MNIGENLRELREKAELKQSELAKLIGVGAGAVSSWEVGRTSIPIDMLPKLAEVLHCEVCEIMGDTKSVGNITYNDIVLKLNSLNIKELMQLESIVKERIKITIEVENLRAEVEKQQARLLKYEELLRGEKK